MAEPLKKVEEELFAVTGEQATADYGAGQPIYKVIGDDKVRVSKELGKLWKHRKNSGIKRMDSIRRAWSEAIRYYNHDQVAEEEHATTKGERVRGDETENIVFSNITTLLPALYSQNPAIEFTNQSKGKEQEEEDRIASAVERVVNVICERKYAPGINLRSKVKKTILYALLCNCGWLKLGWTLKDDSSEAALVDLERISKALEKAKDQEEIIDLEGQLRALEDVFTIIAPQGPSLRTVHPARIIVDENCEDPSLSDCSWLMESDYLPTSYIRARYTQDEKGKNGKKDQLIYKPTHVLKLSTNPEDDNMFDNAFDAIDEQKKFGDYGFKNEEEFIGSQYTKVWYVWDKLMQRVYMFHDLDWTYPIWVWNKPLPISRFFPYFLLVFHDSTDGLLTKGEVTYYLDQQDAINEINAQRAETRRRLRTQVIYNTRVVKGQDVNDILDQQDRTAIGVELPEGAKMEDAFFDLVPPEIKYKEIFDKQDKYAAIDRIANINEVMRGAQLRTNTTQDAVHALQDATQARIGDKQAQIEGVIEEIAHTLAELSIQYLTADQVEELVGSEFADAWPEGMSLHEFNTTYSLRIVAGTTEKPTSKVKQKQAMEMGQVLGQFARSSPAVVLVMLKVFQQAFSEVNMTEDDWSLVKQSIQAAIQQQMAPPAQVAGASGSSQAGAADAAAQDEKRKQNPSLGDIDLKKLFTTVLKILPPDAKKMVEDTVRQGVSPTDALAKLAENMLN